MLVVREACILRAPPPGKAAGESLNSPDRYACPFWGSVSECFLSASVNCALDFTSYRRSLGTEVLLILEFFQILEYLRVCVCVCNEMLRIRLESKHEIYLYFMHTLYVLPQGDFIHFK